MVEKANKKRDGTKVCCTNFHTYNIAYFFLSSPLYNSLNASITTTTCKSLIFICNFGAFVWCFPSDLCCFCNELLKRKERELEATKVCIKGGIKGRDHFQEFVIQSATNANLASLFKYLLDPIWTWLRIIILSTILKYGGACVITIFFSLN